MNYLYNHCFLTKIILQLFNILSKIQEDFSMKDKIQLTYVEKGNFYYGTIDRADFLNQMQHMADWFPGCNDNALKLCDLLPNIESILINKDVIDTQTVPFITYTNIGSSVNHCLKFMRTYKIIWDFFLHHCEEAKNNTK